MSLDNGQYYDACVLIFGLVTVTLTTYLLPLTLTVIYKPMLSLSSKLFIPLVYLLISIPSPVQSHEFTLNRRGHGPKRFLKNRALDFPPVANVAALPSPSSNSQIATSIISQSTASDTSPTTVRVFYLFHPNVGI